MFKNPFSRKKPENVPVNTTCMAKWDFKPDLTAYELSQVLLESEVLFKHEQSVEIKRLYEVPMGILRHIKIS